MTITLIGLGSLALVLFIMKVFNYVAQPPEITAYAAPEGDEITDDTPEIQHQTSRPSSSSQAQVKVIAAVNASDVAIVNPDIDFDIPTEAISSGTDIGTGFGTGSGEGGGGVPGIMNKRCDANDRMKRILESGGNEKCEEAVVKSLKWLATKQNSDGSWGDGQYKASMTGLALLAYLAHCETPMSEEFGDNVLSGMTYLVDLAMKSPVVSHCPQANEVSYDHAVATYALCEAYTFCKMLGIPSLDNLEQAATKAVDKILESQVKTGPGKGSWSYLYKSDPGSHHDLSVMGWNVQALKAAEHANLKPTTGNISAALRNGLSYLRAASQANGTFSYGQGGANRYSLTGVGLLSLQMVGHGTDKSANAGFDWIKKNASSTFWGSDNSTGTAPQKAFVSGNTYMIYYPSQEA